MRWKFLYEKHWNQYQAGDQHRLAEGGNQNRHWAASLTSGNETVFKHGPLPFWGAASACAPIDGLRQEAGLRPKRRVTPGRRFGRKAPNGLAELGAMTQALDSSRARSPNPSFATATIGGCFGSLIAHSNALLNARKLPPLGSVERAPGQCPRRTLWATGSRHDVRYSQE